MNGPDILKQHEGILRTTFGGCMPGSRAVFRGLDLHSEFKNASWMELYVYGITGKRLAPNQLRVLEGLWTCSSYPDSRLWNNRIAALAGSVRSPGGMGYCGAMASSDTQIMGRQVDQAIADFLWRACKQVKAGADLEAVIREERILSPIIKGYGRPVATAQVDERLPVTIALLEREGIAQGDHFKLMFEIETVLAKVVGRPLPITYAAIITAVTLDMGFHPNECYLFDMLVFWAGFAPCFLDGLEREEGASFVLSCERLKYDGVPPRQWDQS
jgi:citrate synthase